MRFALLSVITLFACLYSFSIGPLKNCVQIRNLTPISAGEIIEHTYYKLAYSEMHEQAIWVFYMLTPDFFNSSIYRTDDFRVDPEIKTGSATPEDYKGSGYDRGHLCPAADMKLNESSVSESFFMSNISPQEPEFHRQIWGKLELQVREWAKTEDTIVVVTGPIFRNTKGTIGENRVTIPGYYYKIVLDLTGKKKMIALVFKNSYEKRPIENLVLSVDSVEKLTGIDFFAGLPNEVENKLESNSDIRLWNFDVFNSKTIAQATKKLKDSKSTAIKSTVKQCLGTARSTGKRCRTMTDNANGYCNDHQNQAHKIKH
jgi:endonuclease G, mitochondrial